MNYAKVCILKKPGEFDEPLTYRVPETLVCRVGQAVRVPLRGARARGIIVELSDTTEQDVSKLKPIDELIEDFCISELQVALALSMSEYYRCSLVRALKLMIPSAIWKGKGKRVRARVSEIKPCDPKSLPLAEPQHQLTEDQLRALRQIETCERPVLLQGVTGSGKTEVYLRIILKEVAAGRQALLLVPEIALTPQMIAYFEKYFGEHIAVFHSRLSEGEKLEGWYRVQKGAAPLVIGSRSAIFAPLTKIGVIIIDEEHEWTYKQESMPYYETHRCAEMLKQLTGCRLILGTATPRLETLHKARAADYEHVMLDERVNETAMPMIHVVDLREEFKKRNYSIFSGLLRRKIKERLDKGEQIILFVNQRGMARAVVCRDCGMTETCPGCEVSLKLHGGSYGTASRLICHYCDFKKTPELVCASCQSVNIRQVGLGTERVEEELFNEFPKARVVRADKDTTSDKLGFEPIYNAFKRGDYDILVGTQMVAKGLDFPNVTLIGIVLADIGLHIPDFRSHERLFQLITQVAGRAGRGDGVGEVVLQTYQPEHDAIRLAAGYNYDEFAKAELSFRRKLRYPPFSQLIKFTVVGPDAEKLRKHVQLEKETLEDMILSQKLEASVLAAPAMIPKVAGRYYYHVLVRGKGVPDILDKWKMPKGWRLDIDPVHTA